MYVGQRHLACSTCTTDCHRNGERWFGAKFALNTTRSQFQHQESRPVDLSISHCSQTSIPSNLCATISMMLTTAFRMPLSRSLLLSPSRISKDHVDARRDSARHSGAARSSARCWHVSGPDGGHGASTRFRYHVWMTRSSILWIDGKSGSFFLSHCRRDIHSQDHGRSNVHMY